MKKKSGFALVCLLFAGRVWAQTDGGPDPAKVRVRIGPLWMNPTISLTNLGTDNNVFNEETDPKKDFTFTVSPRTELWLRGGRTWFRGTVSEDLVWYRKYASQRAGNGSYAINWLVPLNRLTTNIAAAHLSTKQRPDLEIDERVRAIETNYTGSASLRVLTSMALGARVGRKHIRFDQTAVFRNVRLKEELSRTSTDVGINISHRVTPLTTFLIEVGREDVEFDFSPDRNTRSNFAVARLTFDPFAALKGSASVGYRDFRPVVNDVPTYSGSTAMVDLSYTAFGVTKITGKVTRDVEFSYDVSRPYFLQHGYSLEVMQQIFGPLDVAVRAGATRLAYRDRRGAAAGNISEPDRVRTYGVGLGYHLGQDIRIAVNVDQQKRTSPIRGHGYEAMRVWTSVIYGL